MAVKVLHKRSAVSGKVPTEELLSYGELAINYADGTIYLKLSDGSVKAVANVSDYSKDEIDEILTAQNELWRWKQYARKEPEMQQMREQNKDVRAASGFDHMGKHRTDSGKVPINEGMWSSTTGANHVYIGNESVGASSTSFAVTCIAGFVNKLCYINNAYESQAKIKFPEAPNGTVIYDSTGDARGSGQATLDLTVDVDPKYGDVAGDVNEAVSRAFEGVVKNGDFRNGSSDWVGQSSVELTPVTGGLNFYSSSSSNIWASSSAMDLDVGVEYSVELIVKNVSGASNLYFAVTASTGEYNTGNYGITAASDIAADETRTFTLTFTPTQAANYINFYGSYLRSFEVKSVIVKPATEEVVINPVDTFGFEFRNEQADAIYPYGCNQSKATTIEGIATVDIQNNPVFDGDTDSVGKGVITADLTIDEKISILSNPEHNLWLDSSGVLQQWIVEQRTFRGAGNGAWLNVNPTKGDLLFADGVPVLSKAGYPFVQSSELGVFEDGNGAYFLVCGVVPRLNQGAHHPGLNPMGASRFIWNSDASAGPWHLLDTGVVNSVLECFTKAQDGSGEIGFSSTHGRPDGKFHDAIYASGQGGVIDYRKSAWDMGSKEEASKIFQKVVNGTYRGEEYLVKTNCFALAGEMSFASTELLLVPLQSNQVWTSSPTDFNNAKGFLVFANGTVRNITSCYTSSSGTNLWLRSDLPWNPGDDFAGAVAVWGPYTNIPVSGNFTMQDVIGDPANIIATPQLSNGWLGGWIPVIPDGTNNTFTHTRKNVGTPRRTYTSGNGATWTNSPFTFNNALNAQVFPLGTNYVTINDYTAFAKQTKQSTNKVVFGGSAGVGDVYAVRDSRVGWGVLLGESLMGKVMTGASAYISDQTLSLDIKGIYASTGKLPAGELLQLPKHPPVSVSSAGDSSAIKTLWHQTADNQEANLNFLWNELVYNSGGTSGNEWGDAVAATDYQNAHGQILITGGIGTYVNHNGDTCLYGASELAIPYGFTKNHARAGAQVAGVDL